MKQQKVWNFPGACMASDRPSKAVFQGCILALSPAGPSTEWFSSGWSSAGLGIFYGFSPACFKDIGNKNKTTNTNVLHSLRSLKMRLSPEFRCVLDSGHTRALFSAIDNIHGTESLEEKLGLWNSWPGARREKGVQWVPGWPGCRECVEHVLMYQRHKIKGIRACQLASWLEPPWDKDDSISFIYAGQN